MSKTEQHFDDMLNQRLADTDRLLVSKSALPGGDVIRQQAELRMGATRMRRKALVGAAMLGMVLVGWRMWMPTGPSVAQTDQIANNNFAPTTEQLLADLQQIRQQQQRLDMEMEVLDLSMRLKRIDHSLKRMEQLGPSTEVVFQRNRDTWMALQDIVDRPTGTQSVLKSNRWQLELLANSFSDTRAGGVAREILETNQIPDFLN